MERKYKLGIILLIVGLILFGCGLCMLVSVQTAKSSEYSNFPGSIITGNDNLDAYAEKLALVIEPLNPDVQSFALKVLNHDNKEGYSIADVCDIYDAIYNNWTYAEDPKGYDYFTKAGTSASLLKGDCDDFAILMASCINAIGGESRVNIAYNNNGGHAFAEVYIGNNKSDVEPILEYIKERYGCNHAYYSSLTDPSGEKSYWLNLDWFGGHPGGFYFENEGDILTVHSNGTDYYYYTFFRKNPVDNSLQLYLLPESEGTDENKEISFDDILPIILTES